MKPNGCILRLVSATLVIDRLNRHQTVLRCWQLHGTYEWNEIVRSRHRNRNKNNAT